MKVNGQLKNAQLEILESKPTDVCTGRIFYDRECGTPVVGQGSDCTRLQGSNDAPAGMVMMWAGNDVGTFILNNRWTICGGQALEKADFPELYDAIGGGFGETATTFNVPDMRGQFIRATDRGLGKDPGPRAAAGNGSVGNAAPGTTQQDGIAAHTHDFLDNQVDLNFTDVTGNNAPDIPPAGAGSTVFPNLLQSSTDRVVIRRFDDTTEVQGNAALETRPCNIAMNFYIKVK